MARQPNSTRLLVILATLLLACVAVAQPGKGPKPRPEPDVQVRVRYLDEVDLRVTGDETGDYVDSMPGGVTAVLLGSGSVRGNLVFCIDDPPRTRDLTFPPLGACAGSASIACFDDETLTVDGCHNVNKTDNDSDPGFLGLEAGDMTSMWAVIGFTPSDGIESGLDYDTVQVRLIRDGVWEVMAKGLVDSTAVLRRREPTGKGKRTAFVDKATYSMPFHMLVCRDDVPVEDCTES